MPSGRCPECDELVPIYTKDEPIEYAIPRGGSFPLPTGSACWWYTCMHPDRREEPGEDGRRPICLGGDRKI